MRRMRVAMAVGGVLTAAPVAADPKGAPAHEVANTVRRTFTLR